MAGNFIEEIEDRFLRWQFGRSMRMQLAFLEDVLLLMADGIPLSDALTLIGQVSSRVEQSVARWMLRRLDEGDTMSDSMIGVFRFDVVGAISAVGELDVAENGLRVLDRLREQHKGRGDAVAELVRPGIYLTFALVLYAFFAWQVWPSIRGRRKSRHHAPAGDLRIRDRHVRPDVVACHVGGADRRFPCRAHWASTLGECPAALAGFLCGRLASTENCKPPIRWRK